MVKDNECPLCSEQLANNYDCPQCGWAVSAVSYTHLTLPTNREV